MEAHLEWKLFNLNGSSLQIETNYFEWKLTPNGNIRIKIMKNASSLLMEKNKTFISFTILKLNN